MNFLRQFRKVERSCLGGGNPLIWWRNSNSKRNNPSHGKMRNNSKRLDLDSVRSPAKVLSAASEITGRSSLSHPRFVENVDDFGRIGISGPGTWSRKATFRAGEGKKIDGERWSAMSDGSIIDRRKIHRCLVYKLLSRSTASVVLDSSATDYRSEVASFGETDRR